MRTVISSNDGVEVSDEYADQVRTLLDKGRVDVVRRTLRTDRNGTDLCRIEVVTYPRPGTGEPTTALVYWDDDSYEVQETGSQAEAEDQYLETVRMTTTFDTGPDDREIPAAETDVPGVPGYGTHWYAAYRIDRGTPDTELRSDVLQLGLQARSAQTLANALLSGHLVCPGVELGGWRVQVWAGASAEQAGAAMRGGRHPLAAAHCV
ncbi:hypothetical protein ACIOGZ_28340 [Kitasatospora sp. NPDC088160]|uniref:hypothetical protein n=1 Tax=Kitasatospora sp. NPDC088160 TaxID=3364072 RepID=UPI003824329B